MEEGYHSGKEEEEGEQWEMETQASETPSEKAFLDKFEAEHAITNLGPKETFASVPLAVLPEERERQAKEQQEKTQAEEQAFLEEMKQKQLAAVPTSTEVAYATGVVMARKAQADYNERPKVDPKKTEKAQEDFKKEADNLEQIKMRKIALCTKLNAYRERYEGKIRFNFLPDYSPVKLKLDYLEATYSQVYTQVNSTLSPELIKTGLLKLGEVLQIAFQLAGATWVTTADAQIKTGLENGFFDEEIDQLCIEYSWFFSMRPEKRIAFKFGDIFLREALGKAPAFAMPADTPGSMPAPQAYHDL